MKDASVTNCSHAVTCKKGSWFCKLLNILKFHTIHSTKISFSHILTLFPLSLLFLRGEAHVFCVWHDSWLKFIMFLLHSLVNYWNINIPSSYNKATQKLHKPIFPHYLLSLHVSVKKKISSYFHNGTQL